MKTKLKSLNIGLAVALTLLPGLCGGQTLVSGNISGTWSPSGNPYIAVDDCTVPLDQTLTIQPGVVVWIGSGVSITANGVIQAVGTPSQRITFEAPISSQFWNVITVNGTAGTNRFNYCDFQNANTALAFYNNSINEVTYSSFQNVTNGITMSVYAGNQTMTSLIMNSTFSNCVSTAIYGEAQGIAGAFVSEDAKLIPVIKNCVFSSSGDGCAFFIHGQGYYSWVGYGYAEPEIMANVFQNLTGTAFRMTEDSWAGSSDARFLNNNIVNCAVGVIATDPWDAREQNNSFVGCLNAVSVNGSLSRAVSYNDFYGNTTNFTGYPVTYGQIILNNRNGTPSDILYNIFQDPIFVSATDFHLQANSPCIDAGEGSASNFDSYFPPSLGSVTNDIGAYGGPNAGQWLVPVSTNGFTLSAERYIGVTINPPSAGHYRLEYASDLAGTDNWIQITNMDLSAPFLYTEPLSSPARFYRAVKLY